MAQDTAWRRDRIESRPLLGRVATMLTPKPVVAPPPQRIQAWSDGAAGEEALGRYLATLPETVVVLHDRRIPESKANIDHIAVAPSGVYVVDAKNYEGRVEVRDFGSWLRPDQRLYVNGRDRTRLVDGISRQLAAVQSVLPAGVPLRAVLCFVGANWPLVLRRPLAVRGVRAMWPSRLLDELRAAGPLTPSQVKAIAETLATTLAVA